MIILVGCLSTYWFSLPLWYLFIIKGEVFSYVPFSVYMIRPEHTVNTPLESWYPAAKKSSSLPNCISILASHTPFYTIKIVFRSLIMKKGCCLYLLWTNEHGYFSNLLYHLHNMLILVRWQGEIITTNSETLVYIVN